MVAGESQVVDELPILAEEEKQQLVHEWNQTEAEYPRREVRA